MSVYTISCLLILPLLIIWKSNPDCIILTTQILDRSIRSDNIPWGMPSLSTVLFIVLVISCAEVYSFSIFSKGGSPPVRVSRGNGSRLFILPSPTLHSALIFPSTLLFSPNSYHGGQEACFAHRWHSLQWSLLMEGTLWSVALRDTPHSSFLLACQYVHKWSIQIIHHIWYLAYSLSLLVVGLSLNQQRSSSDYFQPGKDTDSKITEGNWRGVRGTQKRSEVHYWYRTLVWEHSSPFCFVRTILPYFLDRRPHECRGHQV